MIDLHLHTNMSDGSDEPSELPDKVYESGCTVFSVTDHDDLRANTIISAAIQEKKYALKFITGCEISSVFEGRNLHLLCYNFAPEADCIKKMIEIGSSLRRKRITAMFGHLRDKHNIIIPEEDKAAILSRAVPGKVHITDAAMKLGVKMKRQEFFDKCLDDMESREYKIDAVKVIRLVSAAGGVVSFAHPVEVQREYKIGCAEIAIMAKKLKSEGLFAIEAYHSLHGATEVARYKEIAKENDLFVSGGSDYHGRNKDVAIGQLSKCGSNVDDKEITILSEFI